MALSSILMALLHLRNLFSCLQWRALPPQSPNFSTGQDQFWPGCSILSPRLCLLRSSHARPRINYGNSFNRCKILSHLPKCTSWSSSFKGLRKEVPLVLSISKRCDRYPHPSFILLRRVGFQFQWFAMRGASRIFIKKLRCSAQWRGPCSIFIGKGATPG